MLTEKKDGLKVQSWGAHPHLTPIASLWVPQTPQVWFGRTHKTHWKLFYSWLWFIIAKGYSLKSVKGRGAWGRVPETSTCRASSGVVDSTNFLQQRYVTIYVECCQTGKLIWALMSWVFIGAWSCTHCWFPHGWPQSPALPEVKFIRCDPKLQGITFWGDIVCLENVCKCYTSPEYTFYCNI